jgi:membrane fusion protein, multidrug efflux system
MESTVLLRATVKNEDGLFWPGEPVNVRTVLSMLPAAVLAPASALIVGQTGRLAFVLTTDNTVELRAVELGQPQGDLQVVLRGLAPGESVVTKGQMGLSSGTKVSIITTPVPVTR